MSSWISPRRRSAWSANSPAANAASAADLLLQVVDVCLAGVIFVVPLVLGGRHDLGRLVFITFAASAAVAWFFHQALRSESTPPHWGARILFGASILVLALQLAPLPAAWISRLSPRTAELLPLWSGPRDPGELGVWNTLSLTTQATRQSMAMLLAYGLLFFTVAGRVRNEHDVARLVRSIGLSAGIMAAIAFLQFFSASDKFLWIYEHPSRDARGGMSGAFANRNHFAHFLSLGAPALIAWLTLRVSSSTAEKPRAFTASRRGAPSENSARLGRQNHGETTLAGGLLALVAAGAMLSCSRGGAVAFTTASIVASASLCRLGLLSSRRALALAFVGTLALLAVSFVGNDAIADRLGTLASQSLDDVDHLAGRRKIWKANVAAIHAGAWFGAGAGSHADIYPVYLAQPTNKRYTHAENGYLQVLTENGLVGGALLAVGLALVASACFRALRRADSPLARACAAAATAALAASAIHSLCDFVWFIPACMSVTLIWAACAVRLGELTARPASAKSEVSPRMSRVPKLQPHDYGQPFRWAAALGASVAALVACGELIGPAAASLHWDAYQRMSNAHRDVTQKLLALQPEKMTAAFADSRSAQQAALEMMIAELEAVLRRDPQRGVAHREMANRSLQLFNLLQEQSDNPMPASQIRDAALASQFRTSSDLREWLGRAVGPNCQWLDRAFAHARIAARLMPLDGQPYLRMSEACFLRGEGNYQVDAYLGQAVRVRPYDGDMLFEIGQQWAGRGVAQMAYSLWAQAYQVEGPHRLLIARCVAGRLPVASLVKDFSPSWDALPEFWRGVQASTPAEIKEFLEYAEQQARCEAPVLPPVRAAAVWRSLVKMQTEAGHRDQALAIILRASQAYPEDYMTRRDCGVALAEAGRYAEAAAHLQWCLARRPNDAGVQNLLTRAGRERFAVNPR